MENIKQAIEKYRVIVIVRRLYGDKLLNLTKALYAGGIRLMEITYDQADPDCIKKTSEAMKMLKQVAQDIRIGAGTVLTEAQVDATAEAGGEYVISPNFDPDVIRRTKAKNLVSIPGTMTPSEMAAAHKHGADFVKVFPVANLGLNYMQNIMAPLSNIKFLATAGVTEENFADYLKIGMAGAGISGRLTDKKVIEQGDFAEFEKRAASFMRIVNDFNNNLKASA